MTTSDGPHIDWMGRRIEAWHRKTGEYVRGVITDDPPKGVTRFRLDDGRSVDEAEWRWDLERHMPGLVRMARARREVGYSLQPDGVDSDTWSRVYDLPLSDEDAMVLREHEGEDKPYAEAMAAAAGRYEATMADPTARRWEPEHGPGSPDDRHAPAPVDAVADIIPIKTPRRRARAKGVAR